VKGGKEDGKGRGRQREETPPYANSLIRPCDLSTINGVTTKARISALTYVQTFRCKFCLRLTWCWRPRCAWIAYIAWPSAVSE